MQHASCKLQVAICKLPHDPLAESYLPGCVRDLGPLLFTPKLVGNAKSSDNFRWHYNGEGVTQGKKSTLNM